MPRGSHVAALLTQLAKSLGRDAASRELTWMQEELLNRRLSPTQEGANLASMVERRSKGEPLQYILGNQPFGPLTLKTRPPTLIPRPETEDWTLRVAEIFTPSPSKPLRMLDLCTGSGCIPILLAHMWPRGSTQAFGVDISSQALSLASENAVDHQILSSRHSGSAGNTFDAIQADILHESFASDVLPELGPPFDLVTSNPPYIPLDEYKALPTSVKHYEDCRALLGDPRGEDRGLTFYRQIANFISSHGILKHQGLVVLEVGQGQAGDVKDILEVEGRMRETKIWKDPWGVERVVLGKL